MTFLEQIKIYHDKYLEELSKQVSNKWGINQEDILKLWENGPPPPGPPPSSPPPPPPPSPSPPGCSYKFSRGKKKNTLCNKTIDEDGLCKKHKKKNPRLVMRKHKFFDEYFYHNETRFLLKSKKEGVIGKLDEAGVKILPLDTNDVEKCKELNLKVKSD